MKFKINNKAEIEIDEIIKIVLILLALALIAIGIYFLRDKLSSVFGSLKQALRFGG
jgi:uncharacterized protein YoxC